MLGKHGLLKPGRRPADWHRLDAILASLAVASLLSACGPAIVIDYVDFVRFNGIEYVAPPSRGVPSLPESALGPAVGNVKKQLAGHVNDPSYKPVDGDAGLLESGTTLYSLKGYRTSFRLAVHRADRLILYEADTNPKAQVGSDLLDIRGKVNYIGINSAQDRVTELAAIRDAGQVTSLIDMILSARVDQTRQGHSGQMYFITLHLEDATVVTRAFWPASGELSRGILLPPGFTTAISQAVGQASSVSPAQVSVID